MKIKRVEQINEEANGELLRAMVSLSNNSRLTQETNVMLSEKLNDEEIQTLIRWMRHANSQMDIKNSNTKKYY